VNDTPARRPGGLARLACLVAAGAGYFEIFSIGFPPASRDRLPVLALSGLVALAAAASPRRGLALFAFLFPLVGLGDRLSGGADAIAWPLLVFLGLAGGWTFRFLYDFESAPDPSRADRTLRAVLWLWTMAAALAIVRARTLWALVRDLKLRTVNVEGLTDVAAIRGTVLTFAAVAAGAAFFFILRRSARAVRERVLALAVAGAALSAAVALAERAGWLALETSAFWKATGRFSGAAVDPNSLGMLCASAFPAAAALGAASPSRRVAALLALPVLAAGLVLSGSRSGLVLAAVGLAVLVFARAIPGRARLAVVGIAALVAILALLRMPGTPGNAGARVVEFFDPRVPLGYRASARPVLWSNAERLFERRPVEGAGLGAFAWQLPNLLAEQGLPHALSDNPGSAYLQALAETGAIGFALTLALAAVLAREGWAAVRDPNGSAAAAGAGAALLGFLAALTTGSHWFAGDSALVFFLLAAVASRPEVPATSRWPARLRTGGLAVYAAAAAWSALGTLDAGEAFRYSRRIGFHAEEIGPGGAFRWTRRRFALRVPPGEATRLSLALFTPEGKSVVLTGGGDGETFSRTLEPGQGTTLRLSAPPASARDFVFGLSRAFVPRRVGGSADTRELGVVATFEPGP